MQENPVVTALNADLQAAGTYCAHCLRHIQPDMTLLLSEESNRLACAFCSKACLDANKAQSHSLLFTTEPPLPPEITPGPESPDALEQRLQAQKRFVAYIKREGRAAPLLVARFVARQIALETNKIVESVKKSRPEKPDYMDAEGGEYQLGDHIERLRYLDVDPDHEEFSLLVEVLKHALPGLEHFLIDERHKTLHGKVAYNAYGVTFGESDDKVSSFDFLLHWVSYVYRITLENSWNLKLAQRTSKSRANPRAPNVKLAAPSTPFLPTFPTPVCPPPAHPLATGRLSFTSSRRAM
jgi:import receptor subunit TOM20